MRDEEEYLGIDVSIVKREGNNPSLFYSSRFFVLSNGIGVLKD